jgi:hypothetical protein
MNSRKYWVTTWSVLAIAASLILGALGRSPAAAGKAEIL